jgi:hypothetical protein
MKEKTYVCIFYSNILKTIIQFIYCHKTPLEIYFLTNHLIIKTSIHNQDKK